MKYFRYNSTDMSDTKLAWFREEFNCNELGRTPPAGWVTHLLNGALRLKEDAASQQLCEDAADRPHVDGRAVVPAAHQHLGSSVVLRHHLLSHVT